jgi:NitT/TauT family transport system ATP-binding protein
MTAGPATVKEVFEIGLPRPRKVEQVRLEREFIDIYRDIWSSLGEEVRITRARGAGHAA